MADARAQERRRQDARLLALKDVRAQAIRCGFEAAARAAAIERGLIAGVLDPDWAREELSRLFPETM